MLKSIRYVPVVLALSVICKFAGADERYRENGRIDIFGERYSQTRLTDPRQGRFVFFRGDSPQETLRGVVTVLVNEHYHAALRPGTYSVLCAAQGHYALTVVRREVGASKKNRSGNPTGINANLEAMQTRYFQLIDSSEGEKLLEHEQPQALSVLKNTREAIHTVSRVKAGQVCQEEQSQEEVTPPIAVPVRPLATPLRDVEAPPTLPANVRSEPNHKAQEPDRVMPPQRLQETARTTVSQFSISADTLFAFGKSNRESMPPQGLRSLEDLKERLLREYRGITEIRVIGYADPIGSDLANMQLSQMRADEVKNHLRNLGLTDVPIKSEGRGSSELVANHCPNSNTPVAIQCHQPNRRVVIEVTGVRESAQKSRSIAGPEKTQ